MFRFLQPRFKDHPLALILGAVKCRIP